jgi:hypothetical protein
MGGQKCILIDAALYIVLILYVKFERSQGKVDMGLELMAAVQYVGFVTSPLRRN